MSVTRHTRLSMIAAAASGALVVTMTGTALAAAPLDAPNCSDLDLYGAQIPVDAVAPPERLRLDDLCKSVTTSLSDDTEETDEDATPDTTPAAADDDGDKDSDDGDRDCADFDSQADAQAAFEESSNDAERLDADDDGIACEDHFDTDDQQVAVHPKGGVATGGAALS
jgi:hypothetical protein